MCIRDSPGTVCPLAGHCLTEGVVYRADITTDNDINDAMYYLGSKGATFKERYNSHRSSLNNVKYEHSTTLSTYVWKPKRQGKIVHIRWSVIARASPYKPGSGFCQLCNAEKTEIAFHISDRRFLNKRSELLAKCCHRRKWLLSSIPEG